MIVVLAGALVAALPAAFQPASAAEKPKRPADPPPASAANALRAPDRPAGDFSNPPVDPAQVPGARPSTVGRYDPARATVLDDQTTPTQKVFRNPDGSYTAQTSARPTRFKDQSGKWVDIDLGLVPSTDGTLGAKASDKTTKLAGTADGANALDTPAGTILVRHPEASSTPATVEAYKATYKGALTGRDLVATLTDGGFEQSVVIWERSQPTSYAVEFALPEGVSPRQAEAGLEFVDGSGAVVATFDQGLAFDANGAGAGVAIRLTESASLAHGNPSPGATARAVVSVDEAWARQAALPITIDPTSTTTTTGYGSTYPGWGYDTSVVEFQPTTNYGTAAYLWASGTSPYRYRSLLWFILNTVTPPAPDVYVTESHVQIYANGATSDCTPRPAKLTALGGPFSESTTWSNQPATTGTGIISAPFVAGNNNCPSSWVNLDAMAIAQAWFNGSLPNHGLQIASADEAQPSTLRQFASGNTGTPPYLLVTWGRLAAEATAVAPANNAVVTTTTPVLSVGPLSDPDGTADPTKPLVVWFRGSTSPTAEKSARLIESGWTTSTSYRVPEGVLEDGNTYYWRAWTWDQVTGARPSSWVWSFTVDSGPGGSGPHPRDAAGPVSVDLTNGNLVARASSPTFPTVGGPVGLTYTYNSQRPAPGLTGSYFVGPSTTNLDTAAPVMVRRDPNVYFWWWDEQPGPLVPASDFLVRWQGFITVPSSGTYTFGAWVNDGIRVRLDLDNNGTYETTALDSWQDQSVFPSIGYGSPVPTALAAGGTYGIRVDYYQHTDQSFVALVAKGPFGAGGAQAEAVVPPSWLSTEAPLPSGWTLGTGEAYTRARVSETAVTFIDGTGHGHVYTWTGSGYAPTPGEDGTVRLDPSGTITLQTPTGAPTPSIGPDSSWSRQPPPTTTCPSPPPATDATPPAACGSSSTRSAAGSSPLPTRAAAGRRSLPRATARPRALPPATSRSCPRATSPRRPACCARSTTGTARRPTCGTWEASWGASRTRGTTSPPTPSSSHPSPTSATARATASSSTCAPPWPATPCGPASTPPPTTRPAPSSPTTPMGPTRPSAPGSRRSRCRPRHSWRDARCTPTPTARPPRPPSARAGLGSPEASRPAGTRRPRPWTGASPCPTRCRPRPRPPSRCSTPAGASSS